MPADLTEIRALLASLLGFTEGPWRLVDSDALTADGETSLLALDVDGMAVVYLPEDAALMASAPDLHRHASELADEVERLRAEVEALRASQDDAVEAAVAKERADVVAFLLARSACRAAERDEAYGEGMRQRRGGAAADLSDAAEEVKAGNHARPNGGAS